MKTTFSHPMKNTSLLEKTFDSLASTFDVFDQEIASISQSHTPTATGYGYNMYWPYEFIKSPRIEPFLPYKDINWPSPNTTIITFSDNSIFGQAMNSIKTKVIETKENEQYCFVIFAETPGASKENIEILVDPIKQNELTISYLSENPFAEENLKKESTSDFFNKRSTTITLSKLIDCSKTKAILKNGLLEIKAYPKEKTYQKITVE